MPIVSPLLALVNATVEWRAGLEPQCSTHVRLLDRVHVAVHRGECVVVRHDDPAGAQVLLATLGGSRVPVPGALLRGERQCAPGVRIRRCSVSLEAAAALQEGWVNTPLRDCAPGREAGRCRPGVGSGSNPVVHLVRASRALALMPSERRAWVRWAQACQATGGALVLVVRPTSSVTAGAPSARLPTVPTVPTALHEHAAPAYTKAVQAGAALVGQRPASGEPTDGRRMLWLHHGRLVETSPRP